MEQNIEEGNKLIVEFMGWKYSQEYESYDEYYCEWEERNDGIWYIPDEIENDWDGYTRVNGQIPLDYHMSLYYNSKWDWLMSVIKKINEVDRDFELWDENNIDRDNLTCALNEVDIEKVFELCVMYVKWYNSIIK